MAKKILVNKKTGKEFPTSDPDAVLKKYPKTFKVKPDTKLSADVAKKDAEIVENKKDTKSDKTDKTDASKTKASNK